MENCRNIFNISARHGWSVSMENMDRIRFLNFRRKTSSGVPFCFTIEAGDGTASCIAKEILSFVSAVGYHSMGQTELTVFLTLAATFGQTGFLVGYQVDSSEHPFCLVRYLQESQRLFQITDIGIDGAAVNTQVACCLLY